MRRREIQNFSLKLSDLKEYEEAKKERLARTNEDSSGSASAATTTAVDSDPMKTPDAVVGTPIPKLNVPKTKQEIRARIGFLDLP